MAAASFQDVDSFIRLQKEKLHRDKYESTYGYLNTPNINFDYQRQLDRYLHLPNNLPSDTQLYQLQGLPSTPSGPVQQLPPRPPPAQPLSTLTIRRNHFDQSDELFDKLGCRYKIQKAQLINERHNEYREFLRQKNAAEYMKRQQKQQPVSGEYYATLPLKGMEKDRDKGKLQRNIEYQILQNRIETSEKSNKLEWWKDKNDPDIKPYSKNNNIIDNHGSQSSLNNYQASLPLSDTRNQSDVIAERRLHLKRDVSDGPGVEFPRIRSARSLENFRMNPAPMTPINQTTVIERVAVPVPVPVQPVEVWRSRTPPPVVIDPTLSDILRRPPVGARGVPMNNTVRVKEVLVQPAARFTEVARVPMVQTTTRYSPTLMVQQNTMDTGFSFSEERDRELKAIKAKEYSDELQRQVKEKQMQKQRERVEEEMADKKMLIENAIYNPYGRGGGGAPLKDRDGNVIADLSQIRDPNHSPREPRPPSNEVLNRLVLMQQPITTITTLTPLATQTVLTSSFKKDEEPNFARGGNGIFGEAKTDDQKKQEDKYKAELQKQIEEKKRQKELEREKMRLEDEKEARRIAEQQARIKAELEEEERKKRLKEEHGRRLADESKRIADENKRLNEAKSTARRATKPANRKFQRNNSNFDDSLTPPPMANDFRTNSPPVPAAAKKLGINTKPQRPPQMPKAPPTATADYYVTESRLNMASPSPPSSGNAKNTNKKMPSSSQKPVSPLNEDKSELDLNENMNDVSKTSISNNDKANTASNTNLKKLNLDQLDSESSSQLKLNQPVKRTPRNSRVFNSRAQSPSQVSNTEVLTQLQNLKKHLHNEQIQVENELNNANNKATIGQLSDMHHRILNVRTPPGSPFSSAMNKEPVRLRRDYTTDFQKTYRKDYRTPPPVGSYFRENSVLLDDKLNQNSLFLTDLQKEADERHRYSEPLGAPYDIEHLTARNQQRLRKLRNIEDDRLSMADPNDVLNKFLSRNERRPSAATLNDDTWLRNPA